MRRIFSVFILLFSGFSFSQEHLSLHDDDPIIDSLKQVYATSKSDSLKCIACFKIAHIYGRDQKIELRKKYVIIANRLVGNNKTLQDLAYYYNALDYLLKNDFEGYHKAMIVANDKLKRYTNIAISKDRLSVLHNLNISFSRIGEEDKAMKILLEESIPLAKRVKDYEILALSYKSLAILFLNREDNKKCEYYILQAIKELEQHKLNSINYEEILLESYLIYAEILVDFKRYTETKQYLYKATGLLLGHPDSNLNCNFFYVKGYLYYKLKNHETALNALETGLKYAKLTEDFYSLNRMRLLQFMILKEIGEYNKAKEVILLVLDSDYLTVYDKIKYTKELATVYHKLNDENNSVLCYEKYIAQSDSLHAAEMKSKVLDLESKFNTTQKEKQILLLEKEKNEAALKAEKNRVYYFTFVYLSILLFITVFFLFKYLRNQKKLAKQKEINHDQEIAFLKKEKEIVVMQTIIDSEEAERKRIARDLHDGIGSRLSSLKMRLNHLAESEINKTDLQKLSSELSLSITDLRQTAYNLIPETLLKLGLEMALKDLCVSMANEKVSVYFSPYEISKAIAENNQITIYRIVQELLANALKHSNCDEIYLDCSQNGNLFLISLEDNGIGFNTNDIDNFTGLGLKNIQNRIAMLKGKFDIRSSNAGTNFYIEITFRLMMNKSYKALIVDDHPIVVEGFKNLLGGLNFIEIATTFTKGNSLFGYDDLGTIDIVFLDIFLSDNNGIDLCAKLKKSYPKMIVLGISSQSERSIVMQMIANGANGYLLKSASLNEIKRCIKEALTGELAFCDEVTKMMTKLTVNDFKAIPRLTQREKELLQLLRQGKSTQEISDELCLSYLTVQTHRRNLLAKFQVKNVVELLNFINENGLI